MSVSKVKAWFFVFFIGSGMALFAAEKKTEKVALDKILMSAEELEAPFPEELTFDQMGLLAKGEPLLLSGKELWAVSAEDLYAKMPSSARQLGRQGLAALGIADTPGAKKFGGVKRDGNIIVNRYKYTPTGVRPPFQFSVYYLALGYPEGNPKIFEDVKGRDLTENLKFSHGFSHPEVKKDILADNRSMIQEQQLDPVLKRYAQYKETYDRAFLAADKITADYLLILIKKIEAEIFAVKMKLNFLDKIAPRMLAADSTIQVDALLDTMAKTIESNFYTRELQEEAQEFKALHKDHITTNLPKYEGKK